MLAAFYNAMHCKVFVKLLWWRIISFHFHNFDHLIMFTYICVYHLYFFTHMCISGWNTPVPKVVNGPVTEIPNALNSGLCSAKDQKKKKKTPLQRPVVDLTKHKKFTLVFQNLPNTLWEGIWTPPKAEPQEVFVGPITYSQGMTGRLGLYPMGKSSKWLLADQ